MVVCRGGGADGKGLPRIPTVELLNPGCDRLKSSKIPTLGKRVECHKSSEINLKKRTPLPYEDCDFTIQSTVLFSVLLIVCHLKTKCMTFHLNKSEFPLFHVMHFLSCFIEIRC